MAELKNLAMEHCIFEWSIQNLIYRKSKNELISPKFVMESCSSVSWNLVLRQSKRSNNTNTSLFLLDDSKGETPFRLFVKLKVSSENDVLCENFVKGKNGESLIGTLANTVLSKKELLIICDAYILYDRKYNSPQTDSVVEGLLSSLSNDLSVRNRMEFNDVVLKLSDGEISANRTVLSARSRFFKKIFTQESVRVCELKEDKRVMDILLDFLYSGDLGQLLMKSSEGVFPHEVYTCAEHIGLADITNAFSPTRIKGQSVFETVSCSYVWKIEDFTLSDSGSSKTPLTSPLFGMTCNNSKTKWNLKLFKRSKDSPDHLAVYVYLASPVDSCNLSLQISLVDQEGQSHFTSRTTENVPSYGRCGFSAFAKREDILPLFDDSNVTVRCEMTLPTGKSTSEITDSEATSSTGQSKGFSTLSKHLGILLDTGNMSDITLVVDGGEVKSHKFILAARSAVFEKLVDGERDLILKDVDKVALGLLLDYIYRGTLRNGLTMETMLQVSRLAERFQINRLEGKCFEAIESRFPVDAVLNTLARLRDGDSTKTVLVRYICCHVIQVIGSEDWVVFSKSHPECTRQILLTLEQSYKSSVRL